MGTGKDLGRVDITGGGVGQLLARGESPHLDACFEKGQGSDDKSSLNI